MNDSLTVSYDEWLLIHDLIFADHGRTFQPEVSRVDPPHGGKFGSLTIHFNEPEVNVPLFAELVKEAVASDLSALAAA